MNFKIDPIQMKMVYKLTINNNEYLVKAMHSAMPFANDKLEYFSLQERVTLELLEGLAVPKELEIQDDLIPEKFSFLSSNKIVMEFLPGECPLDVSLSIDEKIGLWLFCAEQFAAFRKCSLIYCDIKSSNILITKDKTRASIIDLESLVGVNVKKAWTEIRTTPGFSAPEITLDGTFQEASTCYSLGRLLIQLLMGRENWGERFQNREQNLVEATEILSHRKKLSDFLQRICNPDIKMRPQNYEECLKEIKKLLLSPELTEANTFWMKMRKPYIDKLQELGI